jgi:hypothetical protein
MQGTSKLFDHVLDIDRTRLKYLIRGRAQHLGKGRQRGGDGLVGRPSLRHQFGRAIEQGGVIEHQGLRFEDAGLRDEAACLEPRRLGGEIRPDLFDRAPQLIDSLRAG